MIRNFLRAFLYMLVRLTGWKYKEREPFGPAILILPHHTSATDGLHAVTGALFYRLNMVTFLIDHFYDKMPKVWSRLGFIRVPDSTKASATSFVPLFRELRKIDKESAVPCSIMICPEGNREYVDGWKSSFIYLSRSLKKPISVVQLNYKEKTMSLSDPIYCKGMTDEEVMEKVRECFEPSWARYPEKVGNPVLLKE